MVEGCARARPRDSGRGVVRGVAFVVIGVTGPPVHDAGRIRLLNDSDKTVVLWRCKDEGCHDLIDRDSVPPPAEVAKSTSRYAACRTRFSCKKLERSGGSGAFRS